MTCTVEFGPSVMSESDLSLISVEAQLFRDGNELNQTSHQMNGLSYTFGAMVSSFSESDNGNYSCSATVRPRPSSPYLSGIGRGESKPIQIVGKSNYGYLMLKHMYALLIIIRVAPLTLAVSIDCSYMFCNVRAQRCKENDFF